MVSDSLNYFFYFDFKQLPPAKNVEILNGLLTECEKRKIWRNTQITGSLLTGRLVSPPNLLYVFGIIKNHWTIKTRNNVSHYNSELEKTQKTLPNFFQMYCIENWLIFKTTTDIKRQIYCTFWHYQKSLNRKNSRQTFPTPIQNWKRLFSVSFKCIVWKIDLYLRQLQTLSSKSIVLFRHYQKHWTVKTRDRQFLL